MQTPIMNFEMSYKIKREEEGDDEISIGTQDTYSQRSTTQEEYKEDSFLLIKTDNSQLDENSFSNIKRDYSRRKKNMNKECCRRTLEYNEEYFLMRIREKEVEREKLEKNNLKLKYQENVRNDDILHEIRECKAAIKKASIRKIIYKHKVYLKCNHEPREMQTNVEE